METSVVNKNIQIANYNPLVYKSLSEFKNAKTNSEIDNSIILQLGNIICKHDLHEVIGICLLHKHFNIAENEKLIRTIRKNAAKTIPVNSERKKIVSYMWKIEEGNNDAPTTIYPLEFISVSYNLSIAKSIENISKSLYCNVNFLEEFSRKLIELKLTNAFGLSVLNKCFLTKDENEIFLETTNEEKRILDLKASKLELAINAIKTQWIFSPNTLIANTSCGAHGHCSHCSDHAGVCHGHCSHEE